MRFKKGRQPTFNRGSGLPSGVNNPSELLQQYHCQCEKYSLGKIYQTKN
jgi:hypothetical protein